MAFIISGGNVVTYAEATDVYDKDQRVFEANEIDFTDVPDAPGSLNNYIEDLTTKTTNRINQKIKLSARWREYCNWAGISFTDINNLPEFNPNLILGSQESFTDMCAFGTLYMYLLPKIADFGNPESSEVQKIQYFESRFNDLFEELMNDFTWYDADNSGTVDTGEKQVSFQLNRRSRGRKAITRVS
tara:strand:+ start:23 stop:583 length:561 start_codon:yes stop_codon:yes gene_type:complete